MRRDVALLSVALACSACGQRGRSPPAEAYQRWQDRLVAITGIPFFGLGPPCSTRWVAEGNVGYWDGLPTDRCLKFEAPRRMHGLWRNDFEGSRFCAAPASECSSATAGKKVWLDYSFGLTDTKPRQFRVQPGGLYAVEFIGRRTKYEGGYGHMGAFDHLMLVDRLISMTEVEPPEPRDRETVK